VELAFYRLSDTYNFEMVARFLENLRTPTLEESLSVFGLFTAALQNILVSWSKKLMKRKSGLGYRRRRFRVRKGQTFDLQRLLPHS
jgi:hypothetical protein